MKLLDDNAVGVSSWNVYDRFGLSTRFRSNAIRVGVALVVFFVVYRLIDIFALSSVARIVVDMESGHETVAAIYYSSNLRKGAFQEDKVKRVMVKADIRGTYNFDLDNKVVRTIRFDPGDRPGTYRVYAIAPLSFYGKIEPIKPFHAEVAVTPGPGTTLVKKNGFLEITAETGDPYVLIDRKIKVDNTLLLLAVPLVVALLVFAGLDGFQPAGWAFWTDTLTKAPSQGQNFDALDGLRGLAALFVLAAHTGLPGCDSLGHVGVVIFFCLSGFLLSLPYAKNEALIVSTGNVRSYYLRRLRRIAPMFYFILILTYLFNGRIEIFIRSLLFIQGNSILWTVLQEIHFYIFLPVVLLINHFVLRGNRGLIVSLLLVLSYCFNHNVLTTYEIFGLGQGMGIHAGIFLCGIMVGYFCQLQGVQKSRILHRFCANPLTGFILLAAISGIEQLWALSHDGQIRNSAVLLSGNFTYLVGALIGLLVLAPGSLPAKMFKTLPLRLIGTVSYSFYLLHPICLKVAKTFALDYLGHPLNAIEAFLFTLVLTFVFSAITYTYIERPFLKVKKPLETQPGQPALSPR